MALASETGNPPSVTHAQIEAWSKLAEDVAAALIMGGQQGLDFLVNIMPEWCEAVDDVNTARQICVDLADRGLRQEAIEWHAEGFFDVADRLDPNRPGWEAWEETLRDRDVITPRIDTEMKEMANRIHEDLTTADLSGQSLGDYLAQLRRNVLLRGHLGERLVILDSIRGLDPAGLAWQEMISPIRRRRVDMIADEVRAAINARNFDALARLRDEVGSQTWGDDLPGTVAALLDATAHCLSMGEHRSQLSQTAATLVDRFQETRGKPAESPEYAAAVQAAHADRRKYAEVREALVQAVRGASAVPEVAALVAESGVKDAIRQLDNAIRESCVWLDEEAARKRVREVAGDIEAGLMRIVESAPRKEGDRESFDLRLGEWRQRAADTLEQARKAIGRLPDGTSPESTIAAFQRIEDVRGDLETHSRRLRDRERWLVIGVVGGIGLLVLVLLIALVVVMSRQ